MSDIAHLPAWRRGRSYESLDKSQLTDHRTGAALVAISQVNAGIVRKDLSRIAESRAALKRFSRGSVCLPPRLPNARINTLCYRPLWKALTMRYS